jgi:predicted small lipoprotein YifL
MSLRILSSALAAALLLSACGQTGPLYLPDRGGDVVTRPAGQTPPPPEDSATRDQPSSEGAPQPSTQPPESSTNKPEKKSETPR